MNVFYSQKNASQEAFTINCLVRELKLVQTDIVEMDLFLLCTTITKSMMSKRYQYIYCMHVECITNQ